MFVFFAYCLFVLVGDDSTSGLSAAHIIGVSFGAGVAGAALASCIVGWMRRRRVPCISVVGILTHIQCYTHYHCFYRCMFVPCHCHVPSLAQYYHKPVKLNSAVNCSDVSGVMVHCVPEHVVSIIMYLD